MARNFHKIHHDLPPFRGSVTMDHHLYISIYLDISREFPMGFSMRCSKIASFAEIKTSITEYLILQGRHGGVESP
jgi:hypothetical protein